MTVFILCRGAETAKQNKQKNRKALQYSMQYTHHGVTSTLDLDLALVNLKPVFLPALT